LPYLGIKGRFYHIISSLSRFLKMRLIKLIDWKQLCKHSLSRMLTSDELSLFGACVVLCKMCCAQANFGFTAQEQLYK